MKIGFDISSLAYQRGVSRYTSNLLRALLEQPGNEYFCFASSGRQRKQIEKTLQTTLQNIPHKKYQVKLQPWPPSVLAKMWRIGLNPVKKVFPSLEVFHSWDWLQPPDKKLPLVSTIHDLAILKYPEVAHPKVLAMHQASWEILKAKKSEIITVSQASKLDILRYLEIPAERITVIHEALPQETLDSSQYLNQHPDLHQQLQRRLQLEQPYILFVGSREPRKNLLRLIEAWKPLAKDYQLIIAGEQSWDGSEKLTRNKALRFLGQVSDLELATLYHSAELLAYPSLDEGFGLPILEAFSYGVPVLSSDIPVIREIAGNAAELVDPMNPEAIRQGLEKILQEKQAESEQRMRRMILRLQLFSWPKTARQTLSVYEKAIRRQAC